MMTTNTKINIVLTGLIAIVIVFGGFFLFKNASIEIGVPEEKNDERKDISSESAEMAMLKKEILLQVEEKQSQFEKLNSQILAAQNVCANIDIAKITQQEIERLNKQNITQAIAGYYTCEAITSRNINRCDFLKNVDRDLFERCVTRASNAMLALEKCSSESIDQCTEKGVQTREECLNMCSVLKNDSTSCNFEKDLSIQKTCFALAKNDVSSCDGIADSRNKTSCTNEYYFYSAIREKNPEALAKIAEDFKRTIGAVIVTANTSCAGEFTKLIPESDCVRGVMINFDDIQAAANTLQSEIFLLNAKLSEL